MYLCFEANGRTVGPSSSGHIQRVPPDTISLSKEEEPGAMPSYLYARIVEPHGFASKEEQ
jgi:hypothetical protein